MWFLFALPMASAAECGLYRVAPADVHALATTTGVPRNSLVRVLGKCADGAEVAVLSVDPVYATDAPREACVSMADLSSVKGLHWVVPAPWNTDDPGPFPQPAGRILDSLPASFRCDADTLLFGQDWVPLPDLGPLRPIEPALLTEVLAVQAHAVQRFGPLALTDLLWTHTGRVSLPWSHWTTAAELEDTHTREQLDTEARQERAVRAHGPTDAYLYFKGADPIRSDVWGTPATIHALIDTLADWQAVCPAADKAHCAVQLGDISWYSGKRPDPLGHRDHFNGTCIDIRLFRSDGSRYEAYWNQPDDRPGFPASGGYDARLTAAFIDHLLARKDVDRVLFNDPAVTAATPAKGHNDHLHVCFEP
jgi:hypothetical protein